MAESNQDALSTEAFRAKKAGSPGSATKSTDRHSRKATANSSNPSISNSTSALSRPSSASRTNSAKRYVSSENLSVQVGRDPPPLDERQEKVKLLREKQAEERRRKNEERRAAFEERRRKKEEDEKERWSTMKDQAAKQKANSAPLKPGTGRKLPTLPQEVGAKRPGSAVERPSSLPKPLARPSSASSAKSPSHSSTSADSLSGGSTPKESPTTTPSGLQPKKSLGVSKSVSAGNLNNASVANRRGSGSSLPQRPSSGTKPRTRSTSSHAPALTLDKQNTKNNNKSQESLLLPGGKLTKSHSTSSIHRVGAHKSTSEKNQKTETKPKAGVTDEATAKQALAERRKKAREEAERQAALDKERQEAERLRKEEEDRKRAEEEAKEEARMRELAELLRKQEEERLRIAAEEKEKHDQEEAERAAVEKKRKEEEEQKAKEEEERKAQEEEERRKKEEAARLERKRRVEQIMSRTRQTASPITTEESNPSAAQEAIDPEDTKRKVNEILQKVKSQSAMPSQMEGNFSSLVNSAEESPQEDDNELDTEETVNVSSDNILMVTSSNSSAESTFLPVHVNGVHASGSDDLCSLSTSDDDNEKHVSFTVPLITVEQEITDAITANRMTSNEHEKENISNQFNDGSSTIQECNVNGTEQVSENDELLDTENTVACS